MSPDIDIAHAYGLVATRFIEFVNEGAEYISVRKVFEDVRAQHKGAISLDNNLCPGFARRLKDEFPQHAHLLTTRKTANRGKNKGVTSPHQDMIDFLYALPLHAQVTLQVTTGVGVRTLAAADCARFLTLKRKQ